VKFEPKTKLRIIVLVHQDLIPPDDVSGIEDLESQPWRTENDVITTLKNMGHHAYCVGLYSDLAAVGKAIEEFKPHIAVNLLEEFDGKVLFDQNVVSYLELMKQPYTGCNPRGLTLARDKALPSWRSRKRASAYDAKPSLSQMSFQSAGEMELPNH